MSAGFALGHYLVRGALGEFCPKQTSVAPPASPASSAASTPTTPTTSSSNGTIGGVAVASVLTIMGIADVLLGSSAWVRKMSAGKGRAAILIRLLFRVLRGKIHCS